jgi:hypothetical protein
MSETEKGPLPEITEAKLQELQVELQELQAELRNVFTCPICGFPKTHYRLYGYRCSINPEHDEIVHQQNWNVQQKKRGKK